MTLPPSDTGQPPTYPDQQPNARYAGPLAIVDSAQYGRVGVVPWTFAQTLIGTAVTLVPWLLLVVGSQLLVPPSVPPTKQLPTATDAAAAVATFIFSALIEGAFLLAPAYYVFWRRGQGVSIREGLRALGLRGVSWGSAIAAFFGGLIVILVASFVYSAIIQQFHLPLQTNAETLQNQARYAPITTIALLAVAVLVAPFCEEIFFRGYLFGGLLRGMPAWVAVVLSSLLFGIAHGDIGSFALLLVIGLVLAIMRWRLGSIWPGMLLHACNNATAAVAIFVAISH